MMTRSPAPRRRTSCQTASRSAFAPRHLAAVLILLAAVPTIATTADRASERGDPGAVAVRGDQVAIRHGGPVDAGKAAVDTIYVLGGPGRWDGRFELPGGVPSWHGWTSEDASVDPAIHWQVSDHDPLAGQYSLWCGTMFDDGPGYGNEWRQTVRFTHAVAAPGAEVVVHWTGQLRTDTEPDYDFVYLQANRGGTWETLDSLDGQRTVAIDQNITLAAGELAGAAGDEVQLRVRFESDGAWSDEDGLWPTEGACWLDDLAVSIDGAVVSTEDFEDPEFGDWQPQPPTGVGDFAHLRDNLQDLDPCRSNDSWQVVFIDDGEVVPGTGGSLCITWCYGPGGYVVNSTGGLLGSGHEIFNRVISPVLAWPANHEDGRLAFDVYRHLAVAGAGTPIFYSWAVRSTADPVAAPIADQSWEDRNFLYFGGPDYHRQQEHIGDLLVPGASEVQVSLAVREAGDFWGWDDDTTPAPYFDNVAVTAWPLGGPQMNVSINHLPNDGFPAQGHLDLEDLASNSVRFDMARSVAHEDGANDPGDSVVVRVAVRRAGAELIREPRMLVRMQANPVFDAVRTLPAGFTRDGALVSGWVAGDSVWAPDGDLREDHWAFDLPDTGFFYPGDVIRYAFEAGDALAAEERWATLPADTTGFARFDGGIRWDPDFTVRALPSVQGPAGGQPELLVWDDAGRGHGQSASWWLTLANLGYLPGRDYDLFTTRGPSSALGNSLSGRATLALMADYRALLYTAGDLSSRLLSNGDITEEPTDDLGLLQDWLALNDRALCMMGDNLYTGLQAAGPASAALVQDVLGADVVAEDVAEMIANQMAPLVRQVPGGDAPALAEQWVASGGCPTIRRFDAVVAREDAVRAAEFTDPAGNDGVYPYAAMIQRDDAARSNRVFSLPFDLLRVQSPPGYAGDTPYGPVPVRVVLLGDILEAMGTSSQGPPVAAPDAPRTLTVSQYPNPFNPRTTIALDLPRTAAVALQIYDLRGKLVRTLVDERLAAGRHEVVWDGADGRGRPVASGVYFAEVRTGGERRLQKMTLVR